MAGPPSIAVGPAVPTPLLTAAPEDLAWAKAARINNLQLSEGVTASALPPPPKTTVSLLWDADFLYVRFVCWSDEIYSPFRGRDAEYYKANVAEVFLDPVGDGRAVVELEVSPDNGVFDQMILCTAATMHSGPDGVLDASILQHDIWAFPCWNLDGLRTATTRWHDATGQGWLVDLAIPSQVLQRTQAKNFAAGMRLRANFLRYEQPRAPGTDGRRLFEPLDWAPVSAGRPHHSPARMGELYLVDPLP